MVTSAYVPMVPGGGNFIANPELNWLYWGPFQQTDIDTMNTYLTELVGYLGGQGAPQGFEPVLWQYGIRGATIGKSAGLPVAPPSGEASLQDAIQQIGNMQAQGFLPQYSPNRIFVVFTHSIVFPGQNTGWCGEHTWNNYGEDDQFCYAICPFPTVTECYTEGTPMDGWQSITSHEIMETCTDPVVGQGWVRASGIPTNEGADDDCLHNGEHLAFGFVQYFADNRQKKCSLWTPAIQVPHPPTTGVSIHDIPDPRITSDAVSPKIKILPPVRSS